MGKIFAGFKYLIRQMEKVMNMRTEKAQPSSVGEILSEEFLKPMDISLCKLADLTSISYNVLEDILIHYHSININEGSLLADAFQTDADFWINLQRNYDIWHQRNN